MQPSLVFLLFFATGLDLVSSAFVNQARTWSTSSYAVLSTTGIPSTMSSRQKVKINATTKEDAFSRESISCTLFGLVGCVADQLLQSTLRDASDTLLSLTQSFSRPDQDFKSKASSTNVEYDFSGNAIAAARTMCSIARDPKLNGKQKRERLQETTLLLQKVPTESNALAISFVFGALSLIKEDGAKASASALSSTVSRNKPLRHTGREIAYLALRAFLVHASCSNVLNLNIITHFAKAFKLNEEQEPQLYAELSANVIRFSLGLPATDDDSDVEMSEDREAEEMQKQMVSGVLALSCQIRPWSSLSPVPLVEAAIPYDFLHSAEQVCVSAHKAALALATSTNVDASQGQPSSPALLEALAAVETLINATMDDKKYRLADNIATNLFEQGGKSRYVEARYCHACDTISKVIHKRQLPIIERQVIRVDHAVAKLEGLHLAGNKKRLTDELSFSASEEIRKFALEQLEEAGEVDAAHRLATLWGMDYVYDEKAVLEAAAARKKLYLQFEEVLPGSMIPELIARPQDLRKAFESFRQNDLFGFDAEWEEDTKGAALLQLANQKEVILIDIPALSKTEEGVSSLKETIGTLLDSSDVIVVGFACRQDLTRLRTSPCKSEKHWMSGTRAVVDAQKFVADDEPKLKKIGLARVCHQYFGKPLDKAEQCSCWSARPLSERQRVYAALDAWACVGIYKKIFPTHLSRKDEKHVK